MLVKSSFQRNGQQGLELVSIKISKFDIGTRTTFGSKHPFHIGDLRVKIWYGIVENQTVDLLLGTCFRDRFIHEMFSKERREAPWHSDLVHILTRQFFNIERPVSDPEPSNVSSVPHKAVVQIGRQVILQPYTETWNAVSPISELSILKPAQLPQQYFHLQVAPEITDTSKDRTFEILMSSFGSTI